jgi:hypothetical protein
MKSAVIAAVVAAIVAAATGTAATLSVTSKNIKNGTIQTVDISAKAKRALKGNRGPRGVAGLRGPQGMAGAAGPQGPAGTQGPQGDKGDKGDKGDLAGRLFERYFCTPGWGVCAGTPKEITASSGAAASYFLTLNLPAGSYAVTGEVVVAANSPDPGGNPSDWRVQCVTRMIGPGYGGVAAATVGDLVGSTNETTLTMPFGMTTAGGEIGIRCFRTAGSGATGVGPNPTVVYALINATEVGSFTTSEQT